MPVGDVDPRAICATGPNRSLRKGAPGAARASWTRAACASNGRTISPGRTRSGRGHLAGADVPGLARRDRSRVTGRSGKPARPSPCSCLRSLAAAPSGSSSISRTSSPRGECVSISCWPRPRGPTWETSPRPCTSSISGAGACCARCRNSSRYLRSARPAAILSGLDHANVVAVLARRLARRRDTLRHLDAFRADGGVPRDRARRGSPVAAVHESHLPVRGRNHREFAGRRLRSLAGRSRIPVDEIDVIYNPINLARIEAQAVNRWRTSGWRKVRRRSSWASAASRRSRTSRR